MTQACFLVARELVDSSFADIGAWPRAIEAWPPEIRIADTRRARGGDTVVLLEATATSLYRDGSWVRPIFHGRSADGGRPAAVFQRFDLEL
jgi:hypothetical protein